MEETSFSGVELAARARVEPGLIGPVALKGVTDPVPLHRASRQDRSR
jgi:hypothetical protein